MDIYDFFKKHKVTSTGGNHIAPRETTYLFVRGEFPERCYKYEQECINRGFKEEEDEREEETYNELGHNPKIDAKR